MTQPRTPPRIDQALAGGGPLGAIYGIEAPAGLALDRLDHYVGVSPGSFIAASLANGITPRELCAAFIENDGGEVFDPAWLMAPAWGEFLRRARMLPGRAASAAWRATVGRRPLTHAIEQPAASLPTGLGSSDAIHERLARAIASLHDSLGALEQLVPTPPAAA